MSIRPALPSARPYIQSLSTRDTWRPLAVSVPDGHAQPSAAELGRAFIEAALRLDRRFLASADVARRGVGVAR
jgi:hypothetical protein